MKAYLRPETPSFNFIVFDVDGVLVPRPITDHNWYEFIVSTIQSKTGEPREAAVKRLIAYGIDGTPKQSQGSVTKVMTDLGMTRSAWNDYRAKHYDMREMVAPNPQIVSKIIALKERHTLGIVSNNSEEGVMQSLEAIGIERKHFACISAFDSSGVIKSEALRYKEILANLGLSFQETIVLGDKFESDIKPVVENGGSGILIEDYRETERCCELLVEPRQFIATLSIGNSAC